MKYLLIALVAFVSVQCSPKLSPDSGWGRGRWVVVEMKGVPVQQSGSRRDAFINFEVNEKKFTGNGGCNQLNGTYTIDKRSIQFKDIVSTKISCEDISFENTFLGVLRDVNRYELNGDDLRLKKRNETILVLRAR